MTLTRTLSPPLCLPAARFSSNVQADLDGSGSLDQRELARTLNKPSFVVTAMQNYDLDQDGVVSRNEWLIAHKNTYDKSEAACKTTLKTVEKCMNNFDKDKATQ